MSTNFRGKVIDTTLGDLIAALSDAAFEICEDKRGAYLLAGLALEEILKKAPVLRTDLAEVSADSYAEGTLFH